jgi:membrane fusion protein, heavy metal efflux system
MKNYIIIAMSLVLGACSHSGEEGHAHDAEGNHISTENEVPRLDYTIWTDKTELFVEFPVLIVGESSRFAAHFTQLNGHKPVASGSVTVSLLGGDTNIQQTVDKPSSLGIFLPTIVPDRAGIYQVIFDIRAPNLTDHIVIENVKVYAGIAEAIDDLGGEENENGSISFLKEQAWKMEFQTALIQSKEIYDVVHTSGKWSVAPSDYQDLIATSNGQVLFQQKSLVEGGSVKKGEVLMIIQGANLTSNNLQTEFEKAKAEYNQVKAEYERKSDLYQSKIIAKSEFEKVEREYQIAKVQFENLAVGYSGGNKEVRAPFDGFIESLKTRNGGFVSQGDELLTITSSKSSILEFDLSPSHAMLLKDIQNVWYQPAYDRWSNMLEHAGEIISTRKSVSTEEPLLKVYAKVNQGIEKPVGSYTKVDVAFGNLEPALVVPQTALMEAYGNYSVVVQLSGESFEMRNITIGRRNGEEVEVTSGLEVGEVVVTKGAFQVKMASMSGSAPAHGHAH